MSRSSQVPTKAMPDLSPGLSFGDLVSLDVKGQADERTHLWLRTEDVAVHWLNELKTLYQDTESQLAYKTADAERYEQECRDRGPDGKDDWFHFRAEWLTWRAKIIRFKQSVSTTLREARQRHREYARAPQKERHPSGERTNRQIILDIEERLARIESILESDR